MEKYLGIKIEDIMAIRIELDGYKPGVAKFLAYKWNGSPNIDMLIQRNQDGYYLSELNQWSSEKTWHPVDNLSVNNLQLTGEVSEWLVDSLISQGNSVRFFIQIRDKQNENYIDGGVVNIAESVLASSALDNFTPPPDNNSVEPKPKTEPELSSSNGADDSLLDTNSKQETTPDPILPEAPLKVEPTITPKATTPVKSQSKLSIIATIVVAILGFVGLIIRFSYLSSKDQQENITSIQVNSQCSLNNVTDDDMTFIQQCLKSKPTVDAIIQLITEAKKNNKCNVAQRLYANQAQQNAKIAMLYAQEYDEKYYQANNCFKPDKETAIYWYETSLTHNSNNALAKERLSELQK
jgi:hypothetical protein